MVDVIMADRMLKQAWKIQEFEPCTVLYQLSYWANWELVILWVHDHPQKREMDWGIGLGLYIIILKFCRIQYLVPF